MNQIPNIEEEKEMELILEVLPHLILGNAEELYNNPDGEMAKNTISEMQRVIRETHHQQLQKAREEERERCVSEIAKARGQENIEEVGWIHKDKGYYCSIRVIERLDHSELDQDNK